MLTRVEEEISIGMLSDEFSRPEKIFFLERANLSETWRKS